MHTCPDDAALRVDIDADVAPAGTCPACEARRGELRADRDAVAGALDLLADDEAAVRPRPDVDGALHRLQAARPDLAPSRPRRPQLVASVAVAVVAALVLATPGGQSAAASALSLFRAERVTAVNVDPSSLESVTALDAVAEVDEPSVEPTPVADLDEAADIAGFDPSPVGTPPPGEPEIMAAPAATVEATLSSELAPTLPTGLDGAVLHVEVPGLVMQQWAGEDDLPALMVVEAGAPVVTMEGGDLADFRAWVLDDPGLPADVADQLAALGDWRTTLPLPVPADAQRDVTVAGIDAVGVDYGVMRGIVWVDGDRVQGVAGPAPMDELRDIGAGLVR